MTLRRHAAQALVRGFGAAGPARLALWLAVVLIAVQLGFTALVRGYFVPHFTPSVHWQYGLRVDSDSQLFHEEGAKLAALMRNHGWQEIRREQFEGMSHIRILAGIYFLAGSDAPYPAYVLNAGLMAFNGVLMFLMLLLMRVQPHAAAVGAAVISCGPMNLFSHSELLREPFVILFLLVFVLGLLRLLTPGGQAGSAWGRWISAGGLVLTGFVAAATFRPYLLLLLLIALSLTVVSMAGVLIARGTRSRFVRQQVLVAAMVLAVLVAGFVVPSMRRVQHYSDQSLLSQPAGAGGERINVRLWREKLAAIEEKESLTRADFSLPHWCTVRWQPMRFLPRALDAKLESLACAREDYLRFCDQELLGSRADRGCDQASFQNGLQVVAHVPKAAAFALFVPFPDLWLDGFGSRGTGLRRAGYVIDGILGYFLLAGLLVYLWRHTSAHPEVLIVALALVIILTVYGLAVPTPFVLARLRLALYIPLLVFGAAGWLLARQSRMPAPAARALAA